MSSYLFFFSFYSLFILFFSLFFSLGCSINAKHGKAMIWVCKAESRSDGDY